MRMRTVTLALLAALSLASAPSTAQTDGAEPKVGRTKPLDVTIFVSGFRMTGPGANGAGVGASANLYLSSYLSVEMGGEILYTNSEIRFGNESTGGITYQDYGFIPLFALLQVHPLGSQGRLDPYFGAGGAYVLHAQSFFASGDFAFVGEAGIACRVGKRLFITLEAHYTPLSIQDTPITLFGGARPEIVENLDTVRLAAGLRIRF